MIIELITLSIGFAIWMFLKPYIGIGGLFIGGIVAYYIRPFFSAIIKPPNKKNPAKENLIKDNQLETKITKNQTQHGT